jgi:hypothetical protein
LLQQVKYTNKAGWIAWNVTLITPKSNKTIDISIKNIGSVSIKIQGTHETDNVVKNIA